MATDLEKRLSQQLRDLEGGNLLVPLLHDLLRKPLNIDTEEDAQFLYRLAMKQVERDKVRQEKGVFSPSGLASCLRRVYLQKNWKELGLTRVQLPAIEPHFYFFTGDFLHLKWQYALYKLSFHTDEWMLVDVEVPVISKRKDHGGTLDVLGILRGEPVIVDVKGLNIRGWRKIADGDIQHEYRIQVTDYGILFNSMLTSGTYKPSKAILEMFPKGMPKVKRGILLAENKGGPDHAHPAALAETVISIKENAPDVRARLETLRAHQEEGSLPEIECESSRTIQFTGCPFAEHCKKEVKARESENAKNSDSKQYRLARPKRTNRSRRPRPK